MDEQRGLDPIPAGSLCRPRQQARGQASRRTGFHCRADRVGRWPYSAAYKGRYARRTQEWRAIGARRTGLSTHAVNAELNRQVGLGCITEAPVVQLETRLD